MLILGQNEYARANARDSPINHVRQRSISPY